MRAKARRGVLQLPVYPGNPIGRLRRRGTGPSGPADVAGLDIWLDASDTATLHQNSDGTGTVSADTDPVGAWDNKVAGGGVSGRTSATQATAASRPAYRTSSFNGHPGVSFDGTNDSLAFASGTWFPSKRGILFLVQKSLNSAATQYIFGTNTAGSPFWHFYYQAGADYRYADGTGSGQLESPGPVATDAPSSIVVIERDTDTNLAYRRNRMFKANVATGNFQPGDSVAALGATTAGASFHRGHLHELLYYRQPISAADRTFIEDYLWNKWFVPNGLIPDRGLMGWWKADGTLWNNSARTTPIADTLAVGAWDDASGNSQNLLQATGSAQPIYRTAIQNGLPVVRFDGANHYLKRGYTPATQPYSIFCAMKNSGPSGRFLWAAASAASACEVNWNTATQLRMMAGGTAKLSPDTLTCMGVWTIYSAFWNNSPFLAEMYLNGGTAAVISGNAGTAGMAGLSLCISGPTTLANCSAADIGEFIIYNRIVTAAERAQVESYLASKWAITLVP